MIFSELFGLITIFGLLLMFLRACVITLVAKRHVITGFLTEVGLYLLAFSALGVCAKCVALILSGFSAYTLAWAQIVSV